MNSIDAIKLGINKGKKIRKARRIININLLVIFVIVTSFTTAVNVSPSFASSMSEFPILKDIVDFITIGDGFDEVYDRGYYKEGYKLAKNDKHELNLGMYYLGVKKASLILNLSGIDDNFSYMINNIKIFDTDMNEIVDHLIMTGVFDQKTGQSKVSITTANELTSDIIITFAIEKTSSLEKTSENIFEEVSITLKKDNEFKEEIIEINKKVESDEIIFDINNLTITPTDMILSYNVTCESASFLNFDEIFITTANNKYEELSISVSRKKDKDGLLYYFESPYFDEYDDMKLVIRNYHALPNNDKKLIFNLKDKKIVTENLDKIQFRSLLEKNDIYILELESDAEDEIGFINGNEGVLSQWISSLDDKLVYSFEIDKSNSNKKIELEIFKYSNLIEFNKIIEIKGNGSIND